MDNIRQKKWFSTAVFLVIASGIPLFFFIYAKTFSSYQPSRGNLGRTPQTSLRQQNTSSISAQQKKVFMLLNKKISAGKAELVYRGLVGQSKFQIDVIVPEFDPQVSYPYRFSISDAKKSFRLVNRNFKLISAKKGALQIEQIK